MHTVSTHCPYCALQCGMRLAVGERGVQVLAGHEAAGHAGLCLKGWTAAATLGHPDRLLHPLVRGSDGRLAPASWHTALETAASRFRATQARHGANAVGVFGSGALTNEKAYLLGKFARVALGTANVDYNGRFCMSSAAAAQTRAFGVDRGLPFPLADVSRASVVLLAGGNPAETMPPMMQHFEALLQNGGRFIVADPRRTATAAWATHHLRLRPGTDAALANGLLHVLLRERLVDEAYIRGRTVGFDLARRTAAAYWPSRVELMTGVPEAAIVETARLLGAAPRAMILTARGPEQHAQGVTNALAYINVALALGAVGRPFSGYGSLTGQANGQGGREHGQKADQLPGYRLLADPAARRHVAQVWQIAETALPGPGKSAYELLESLGRDVHALFVMGSNVAVSAPDALQIERRLDALDTLVVADFFLSETAARADVVLPAAQWAEEDGTTTNLEGRVIERRAAVPPPGEARTDLQVLTSLAAALGAARGFEHETAAEVFDEMRRATRGGPADYSGISYPRLAGGGVFWPCPSEDHPGTPRLFADRFATPDGRARFHDTPHQPMADLRDEQFPLHLTTGRVLAHYQSGTQTRRVADLQAAMPHPVAELHPTVARRAGVADGDRIVLTTRRGSASFVARLTRRIREDTVFVPFHWGGEQSANRLTIAALDPVSRMPEFKVCAVRVERDITWSSRG